MADAKISALPAASTPLAGTEVLPIVQGGVTDKVSVANLTAGRAVSAASLTLTTTPLAAGSGGTGASSAFTANGIVYASSTSVLATGSALTFDGTNLLTTGRATAASFVPSGSTVPTNGMYLSTTNTLAWATNSGNRMLLDPTGCVAIGGAISVAVNHYVRKNITGAASSFGYLVNSTVQSDVTSAAYGYKSILGTQAASFNNSLTAHFAAEQATIGAASAITTQIAFRAEATLIGAGFNVGFQAENTAGVTAGKVAYAFVNNVNIATGGGTTWGWYGQGTAPNAFAGLTRFGAVTAPVNTVDITGSLGRGAPVTKTGDFTLAATENWVIVNQAGTTTVTLPAASSWTGREVMFKTIQAQTLVSASSNVVPLVGGAAGTAILAATAGKWATCVSDGTNWILMAGN